LDRGAFATLLGLRLRTRAEDPAAGQWAAIALGDSCLFQIRDDRLLYVFPVTSAAEFDNSPVLVPSRPDDFDRVTARAERATGDWQSGDCFYLATDALAAWFLEASESGDKPWRVLADIDTEAIEPSSDWI